MEFETIIGLEVHVELNTVSKLFGRDRNRFGDEPNTNIGVVATGQPGALPVLNKEAVRRAVRLGLALGSEVQHYSRFDRKSYFYPDSPRNFQITQYTFPIIKGGTVVAEVNGVEKSFAVTSAHLEDDAGMLKHFSNFSGVDYNRAGVPLIEIVSEPCMRSPEEAAAYAMSLKAILEYIDASDCNMEEGSLRIDANVSVREKGEEGFRNKVEIKNMNSFSYLMTAIRGEVERQKKIYLSGGAIVSSTYRWDAEKGETILMRKKEMAEDYRYFPEPDLVPIVLTPAFIEEERKKLPELPRSREKRYVETLGISPHHAFLITANRSLADYFDRALTRSKNGKSLCSWMLVEFSGRLKEKGIDLDKSGIPAESIGELVQLIDEGKITGKIAKSVADEMVVNPTRTPLEIVTSNPAYLPVSGVTELGPIVDEVLRENSQSIQDFRQGKERAFAFLVGQVMKKTQGKADPAIVHQLLKQGLEKY
jgi:aspartyl-tRNA(Asn)/glutamyl-tRNA(Gln) amidotransferase subunit B